MATGQLASSDRRRAGLRLGGVPVLIYHGLAADDRVPTRAPDGKYWVRQSQFADHLREIGRRGYEVGSLADFWGGADSRGLDGRRFNERLVVLTFDDGRASDYEVAYPLLLAAGARADFFVNTAVIGHRGFLSWQQMAEMQRAGMSFYSHSHDHIYLSRLPTAALEYQLGYSKALLEDRLGTSVHFLAVPYGATSRHVIQTALRLGYRAACHSWAWPARPGARTVSRVPIYGYTGWREFRQLLARNPLPYAARVARSAALYLPKRLLLEARAGRPGVRMAEERG